MVLSSTTVEGPVDTRGTLCGSESGSDGKVVNVPLASVVLSGVETTGDGVARNPVFSSTSRDFFSRWLYSYSVLSHVP